MRRELCARLGLEEERNEACEPRLTPAVVWDHRKVESGRLPDRGVRLGLIDSKAKPSSHAILELQVHLRLDRDSRMLRLP